MGIGLALTLIACALSGAAAMGATAQPATARTYDPGFRRLPPNSGVLASGNDTLLLPADHTPDRATLIDQQTDQRSTIRFSNTSSPGPPGCTASGLTPVAVIWECDFPTTPGAWFLETLAGERVRSLPVFAAPSLAGTDWLKYDKGADPHNPGLPAFVNPATGQIVDDTSQIGGRTYPDLNSPRLFHTACQPVTLAGSSPGGTSSGKPGSLAFFGSVAVGADADGGGVLRLHRCGSHTITRIRASSAPGTFARNGRVIVWDHAEHPVTRRSRGSFPAADNASSSSSHPRCSSASAAMCSSMTAPSTSPRNRRRQAPAASMPPRCPRRFGRTELPEN